VAHSTSTAGLLVRVLVAFALTYVLGYERELRGSPAGDRTFSLIGTASAVLGNLAGVGSPNAIAGAVTGIGFIGGGIVVRRAVRTGEIISGITTAASIFATAAIGAAAGAGLLAVAALATGLILVALEGPHLPLLRLVDARRWSPRFRNDEELYRDDDTAVLPDTVPPADRDQQTLPTSDDVGPRVRGLPPAWLTPRVVVSAGRARYAARSENKSIPDGQGARTSTAGHHSARRWHHRCHRFPNCGRPGWT
jgi:putative Mg2+ transporter-C (MgtC) family protein